MELDRSKEFKALWSEPDGERAAQLLIDRSLGADSSSVLKFLMTHGARLPCTTRSAAL